MAGAVLTDAVSPVVYGTVLVVTYGGAELSNSGYDLRVVCLAYLQPACNSLACYGLKHLMSGTVSGIGW